MSMECWSEEADDAAENIVFARRSAKFLEAAKQTGFSSMELPRSQEQEQAAVLRLQQHATVEAALSRCVVDHGVVSFPFHSAWECSARERKQY